MSYKDEVRRQMEEAAKHQASGSINAAFGVSALMGGKRTPSGRSMLREGFNEDKPKRRTGTNARRGLTTRRKKN